jgi:hypothetical protein
MLVPSSFSYLRGFGLPFFVPLQKGDSLLRTIGIQYRIGKLSYIAGHHLVAHCPKAFSDMLKLCGMIFVSGEMIVCHPIQT